MKIFKNRFGRQPLWWHLLNIVRVILSIFIPYFRIDKYPNRWVQYKGDVGKLHPKKWDKHDISKWSTPAMAWGLALLVWGSNELLNWTEYDYGTNNTGNTTTTVVASTPNTGGESDENTFTISKYTAEQIENLANTIAGQNAIWPGYKGDPKDHRAVERHFQEQFAKFINSGIIPVEPSWGGRAISFYYAVTDEGVIAFVGYTKGQGRGLLTPEKNPYAYQVMSEGITGRVKVDPARDESGEPIIMLYRIQVRFQVQ
ncbi:MAG: hypothetical protein ACR2M7_02575 [Bdellovibrionales bacterium]